MNIRQHLIPTIFAAALTLVVSTPAMAQTQNATPTDIGAPSEGYPVAIHEGSCEEPTEDPAFQVEENALSIGVDQEDPTAVGTAITRPVFASSGTLDVDFDDLASTEHVVAIHANPQEFGTVVACGAIAGIEVDGQLVIALVPAGDSDVSGVAMITREDDQTQITVYIIGPEKRDEATPAA
jgi:hypothetical protein